MNPWKTMWGVLSYEFRMQIRRPVLWLTFLGFALLDTRSLGGVLNSSHLASLHLSAMQLATSIAVLTNWLSPLGVGIFLADRLRRDRRTRVEEVLNSLPGTLKMRVLGKYLGTFLASLVPALLVYLLAIALMAWLLGNLALIPAALPCYIIVILPGMLFVAAFSLALPMVIWVPLYQFLFFGYWFWGNLFPQGPGLPTLSGTILTPIGSFIANAFFGVSSYGGIGRAADGGIHQVPMMGGVASIVVMVGLAILVLIALYQYLRLEQARQ